MCSSDLAARIGAVGVESVSLAKMFGAALAAAAAGHGVRLLLEGIPPLIIAFAAAAAFGAVYYAAGYALGLEDARALLARVARRLR